MERGAMNAGTLRALARKYRWALAVVLLGVLLMLLPSGTNGAHTVKEGAAESISAQMETALAAVEGVGRMCLVLSAEPGNGRWTGALVVCEGADSAAVRLRLTTALSALTGLSSDKIAIMKGTP